MEKITSFGEVRAGGAFTCPGKTYFFDPPDKSPDRGWSGRKKIYVRIGVTNEALDLFSGFPKTFDPEAEVELVPDEKIFQLKD